MVERYLTGDSGWLPCITNGCPPDELKALLILIQSYLNTRHIDDKPFIQSMWRGLPFIHPLSTILFESCLIKGGVELSRPPKAYRPWKESRCCSRLLGPHCSLPIIHSWWELWWELCQIHYGSQIYFIISFKWLHRLTFSKSAVWDGKKLFID